MPYVESNWQNGVCTPSEALEAQLRLKREWVTRGWGDLWAERIRHSLLHIQGAAPSVPDIQRMGVFDLDRAETFLIRADICDLLWASLETLPDVPLTPEMITTMRGFAFLEKSIRLEPVKTDRPEIPALKAFTWDALGAKRLVPDKSGLLSAITFYEQRYDDGAICPISHTDWDYGQNWGSDWYPADPNYSDIDVATKDIQLEKMRAFVLALWNFMQQKIVTTTSERLNRAARHRFQRSQPVTEPPLIRVVALRVQRHRARAQVLGAPTDWHCRWYVRGHWRHQFYRSRNGHQLKWITPYIKGPENKPLRSRAINVFDVKR